MTHEGAHDISKWLPHLWHQLDGESLLKRRMFIGLALFFNQRQVSLVIFDNVRATLLNIEGSLTLLQPPRHPLTTQSPRLAHCGLPMIQHIRSAQSCELGRSRPDVARMKGFYLRVFLVLAGSSISVRTVQARIASQPTTIGRVSLAISLIFPWRRWRPSPSSTASGRHHDRRSSLVASAAHLVLALRLWHLVPGARCYAQASGLQAS